MRPALRTMANCTARPVILCRIREDAILRIRPLLRALPFPPLPTRLPNNLPISAPTAIATAARPLPVADITVYGLVCLRNPKALVSWLLVFGSCHSWLCCCCCCFAVAARYAPPLPRHGRCRFLPRAHPSGFTSLLLLLLCFSASLLFHPFLRVVYPCWYCCVSPAAELV